MRILSATCAIASAAGYGRDISFALQQIEISINDNSHIDI